MSQKTEHGDNIATEILGQDAYGAKGDLTYADIWCILDALHTQAVQANRDTSMLERWMRELETVDSDLPLIA